MNVWGEKERSWRKSRKRAVSPIIATILLVAITVVLAAVLYVLISGLTHGPSSAPLGTDFGLVNPVNNTGSTSAPVCTSATAEYCYTVELAGIGGGITTSSVTFSLRNSLGSPLAWPTGLATISLVSATSPTVLATYAITGASPNTWTPAAGFSGGFASGQILVFYYATGAGHAGLFGTEIAAIGGSGYSGSVTAQPFS